jgi:hypothetical protein
MDFRMMNANGTCPARLEEEPFDAIAFSQARLFGRRTLSVDLKLS